MWCVGIVCGFYGIRYDVQSQQSQWHDFSPICLAYQGRERIHYSKLCYLERLDCMVSNVTLYSQEQWYGFSCLKIKGSCMVFLLVQGVGFRYKMLPLFTSGTEVCFLTCLNIRVQGVGYMVQVQSVVTAGSAEWFLHDRFMVLLHDSFRVRVQSFVRSKIVSLPY